MNRAVKAGLLTKRAVQVMDSSPMLVVAAGQDTYKLIRTALHKLVNVHAVAPASPRHSGESGW